MNQKYYIERSGGAYEGRWWSTDEQRYFRRRFISLGEAESYARSIDMEPLFVE